MRSPQRVYWTWTGLDARMDGHTGCSVNGLGKYECAAHGNGLITSTLSAAADTNWRLARCTIKQMHRVKCNVVLWRVCSAFIAQMHKERENQRERERADIFFMAFLTVQVVAFIITGGNSAETATNICY